MDAFVNEKDFELLADDRCTFQVLDRILRQECELIRTDHERLILCHSASRYPVWIWTPDGLTEAEKEAAWKLASEFHLVEEGFEIIMKYDLAEYFMARAEKEGMKMGCQMEMMAYDCPEPKAPEFPADGELYECTPEDTDEVVKFLSGFFMDLDGELPPDERILAKAQEYIGNQAFFQWKTAEGTPVACCYYRPNQDMASIGGVWTVPEYRRKHYAQQLVYAVTKKIAGMGYLPMLYTDANYAASNACYQKIGYTLRGRLCTIKRMEEKKMI